MPEITIKRHNEIVSRIIRVRNDSLRNQIELLEKQNSQLRKLLDDIRTLSTIGVKENA